MRGAKRQAKKVHFGVLKLVADTVNQLTSPPSPSRLPPSSPSHNQPRSNSKRRPHPGGSTKYCACENYPRTCPYRSPATERGVSGRVGGCADGERISPKHQSRPFLGPGYARGISQDLTWSLKTIPVPSLPPESHVMQAASWNMSNPQSKYLAYGTSTMGTSPT